MRMNPWRNNCSTDDNHQSNNKESLSAFDVMASFSTAKRKATTRSPLTRTGRCYDNDDREEGKQDENIQYSLQEDVDDKNHDSNCLYNKILTKKTKYARVVTNKTLTSKTSRFQSCPICLKAFPIHAIERHAATCNGPSHDKYDELKLSNAKLPSKCDDVVKIHGCGERHSQVEPVSSDEGCKEKVDARQKWKNILKNHKDQQPPTVDQSLQSSSNQPLPGLFIFEEFISVQEEEEIISMLDGKGSHADSYLPWKPSKFNGRHAGKRWGVHCSLRDRKVYPEDNPLPPLLLNIIDRIRQLQIMKGCVPNEGNAIDYHKKNGDYLKNHVDDRQLSKEPIANLSLAGDCYMTFRLERHTLPQHFPKEHKVLLKRRTLQVLSSNARYDYSHGIQNEDLLSDRRISITMRESPLSR